MLKTQTFAPILLLGAFLTSADICFPSPVLSDFVPNASLPIWFRPWQGPKNTQESKITSPPTNLWKSPDAFCMTCKVNINIVLLYYSIADHRLILPGLQQSSRCVFWPLPNNPLPPWWWLGHSWNLVEGSLQLHYHIPQQSPAEPVHDGQQSGCGTLGSHGPQLQLC